MLNRVTNRFVVVAWGFLLSSFVCEPMQGYETTYFSASGELPPSVVVEMEGEEAESVLSQLAGDRNVRVMARDNFFNPERPSPINWPWFYYGLPGEEDDQQFNWVSDNYLGKPFQSIRCEAGKCRMWFWLWKHINAGFEGEPLHTIQSLPFDGFVATGKVVLSKVIAVDDAATLYHATAIKVEPSDGEFAYKRDPFTATRTMIREVNDRLLSEVKIGNDSRAGWQCQGRLHETPMYTPLGFGDVCFFWASLEGMRVEKKSHALPQAEMERAVALLAENNRWRLRRWGAFFRGSQSWADTSAFPDWLDSDEPVEGETDRQLNLRSAKWRKQWLGPASWPEQRKRQAKWEVIWDEGQK